MRQAVRQVAWTDQRYAEIYLSLIERPLLATIPAIYSTETDPPVGAELVAWVIQTSADPDRALAEAIFSAPARDRLMRLFATARADRDSDAQPESAWGE